MKAQLLDSFAGTNRGFSASSELRAEINELITALEATNPTDAPNQDAAMLSGASPAVRRSAIPPSAPT